MVSMTIFKKTEEVYCNCFIDKDRELRKNRLMADRYRGEQDLDGRDVI
jgi:hypothetical protein